MKFRHEWKHEISRFEMMNLLPRLTAVMKRDSHTVDDRYEIRSLYFDNLYDKALREKIDGVNQREKFRIRYYNNDLSYIVLEKKGKINGLCYKEQARLKPELADAIAKFDREVIEKSEDPLVKELLVKMDTEGLRGKTIVDYTRIPFVFGPGDVRVTLDFNIRSGMNCTDFLDWSCRTVPVTDGVIVLEVKWDEFLPTIIRDIVQVPETRSTAFSKYAACRIYG